MKIRMSIASSHKDAADGHIARQRTRSPVWTSDQRATSISGCAFTGVNGGVVLIARLHAWTFSHPALSDPPETLARTVRLV